MCLASHGSNEEHYEISLAFALHSAKLASVCVSMSWLTNKVWAANCLLAAGTGWLSINYSPSLNSWLAGLLYSLDSPCNILARTILCATVHIIPKPYNYIHFSFFYSYIFFRNTLCFNLSFAICCRLAIQLQHYLPKVALTLPNSWDISYWSANV